MPRPAPLGPHDPSRIGPYRLRARLGRGGQGEVYLGTRADGVQAAIKILHVDWDDSGELKRQLQSELENAQKVAQFVTANVLEFDLAARLPYIASEYIEGPTLDDHIRETGPLRGSSLHQFAIQTMTALEAIHHVGVVHCDFKPGNIIMGQGGARVIDFGIARTLDTTHNPRGPVVGTYRFMAPEQIMNARLSPAVDMFAWGSTMVYAATGHHAFPGTNAAAITHQILHDAADLYDLAAPFRPVVRACLQKASDRRPTAAQARRRLLGPRAVPAAPGRRMTAPARSAHGQAQVPTRVEPPARPPTGHWRPWAFVAAAVVTVIIAAALSSAGADPPSGSPPRVPANTSTQRPSLADYIADWKIDTECVPKPTTSLPAQRFRYECALDKRIRGVTLYCVEYRDAGGKDSGRPPQDNSDPSMRFDWGSSWSHRHDHRHGRFIAYQLLRAPAIWWEDSTAPVACMIHAGTSSGVRSHDPLLREFISHELVVAQPPASTSSR